MSQTIIKRDIYDEAAAVIQKAQSKEKSLKSLVYDSNTQNIRQLYALVCESLKFASVIDKIMENTAFLQRVSWMNRDLALVLLYDFLFGKKLAGACSGKYRKAVVKQKHDLKAELQRMKEEKGVTNNRDLLPNEVKDEVGIPRYARVNLLKTSVDEVVASFIEAGYVCVMTAREAAAERKGRSAQYISSLSVDIAKTLGKYDFAVDLHLGDVLVFAVGTDFHAHPLYLQGNIILMDKASCFPAHVLCARPGSHVIDACSAPGNKTSHVASLLGNKGKIYSFDLDAKRIGVMKTLLGIAGVTVAETIHQDFLTSDPTSPEYSQVECIIVDPSCSGSGMANRKDFLVDESVAGDPTRLGSLQQLQRRILTHALSFPSARRVVYSTCSIHPEENECVVKAVLEQCDGFRLVSAMQESWDHRGLSIEVDGEVDIGGKCMRASPKADLTNGFFVASFERDGENGDDTLKVNCTEPSQLVNGVEGESAEAQGKKKKKSKKRKRGDSEMIGEDTEPLHATEYKRVENEETQTKKKRKSKKGKEMAGALVDEDTKIEVPDSIEVREDAGHRKKKKKGKKFTEGSGALIKDVKTEVSDNVEVRKDEIQEKKKKKKKSKKSELDASDSRRDASSTCQLTNGSDDADVKTLAKKKKSDRKNREK